LGRATTFLVAVAVIVALSVGPASAALAGTGVGAAFNPGKTNMVDTLSSLVGSTPSMLKVDNNGYGTGPSGGSLDDPGGSEDDRSDEGGLPGHGRQLDRNQGGRHRIRIVHIQAL
jgi:hypothetical protein